MCGLKALATWILFSWKWLDLEAFFFFFVSPADRCWLPLCWSELWLLLGLKEASYVRRVMGWSQCPA